MTTKFYVVLGTGQYMGEVCDSDVIPPGCVEVPCAPQTALQAWDFANVRWFPAPEPPPEDPPV